MLEPKGAAMQLGIGPHPEETELEQYSMGALVEARLEVFEEHLLACNSCQDRLLEMEAYVNAMRSASPKVREAPQPYWAAVFQWPRPAWVATFALSAVVLAAARIWIVAPSSHPEMASVVLRSSRGIEGLATTKAPAGKPLSLTVDLTELPALASYRLEIVERTGRQVWEAVASPADGKIIQATTNGLAAGQYYVRLYAPGGELLREFSLGIK
jgi:hypothetical protein